ncbi:MAG: hypothetical protein OEW37_03150 [Rhodospirillaceae bacterium]|nr:hypothetical protein [Rhodospirillaceae bacterium]
MGRMKTILSISTLFVSVFSLVLLVYPIQASALPINKCIRIIKSNVGSETLVNRCNVCMKTKIERKRPGNSGSVPTMRDYTMPSGSHQPLPFKGPGGTRIVAEFPCKG